MQKRWTFLTADSQRVSALFDALKINRTLCEILVKRGIHTFEQARSFFRPSLDELHSPWLMKDMRQAVDRLLQAIRSGEKILVYGDYDVDGTTAVASMYQYLRALTPHVDYYIPHRYREGYGISRKGIDHAIENGFSLVVSLDCGIKSAMLIGYAREAGVDFIVCDHHLPDHELPPATAILNPKQTDCSYPYKDLCGCGVGFKLMCALSETLGLPAAAHLKFLDLVATAIAADIVPITGENRILAYHGLKQVNEQPSPGIHALMHLAEAPARMYINNLVFIIAPRINAAGRMDDANKAVQLFIEQDFQKALSYARMLHSDNTDRKEADLSITEEALQLIKEIPDSTRRRTTVVYQEHWHKGVVGIVASRLIEKYYRPTVVLTRSGDIVAGSARSVAGFNLYEAIHACREHLIGYGGHYAAAGMTLEPDKVEAFAARFEEVVQATIKEELLIPELVIDAEIRFAEISLSLFNILDQMEPFGPENMRPLFVARNVSDTGYSKLVKEQHIRFHVKQGNIIMNGIGFNLAAKFPLLQLGPVDLVFTIELNEWNGQKSIQLKVCDLRPADNTKAA